MLLSFFFNDTATTEIYTLSLHDALPICPHVGDELHLRAYVELDGLRPDDITVEVVYGRSRSDDTIEAVRRTRSEEHTSELQSRLHLVCRLLLEKKNKKDTRRLPA